MKTGVVLLSVHLKRCSGRRARRLTVVLCLVGLAWGLAGPPVVSADEELPPRAASRVSVFGPSLTSLEQAEALLNVCMILARDGGLALLPLRLTGVRTEHDQPFSCSVEARFFAPGRPHLSATHFFVFERDPSGAVLRQVGEVYPAPVRSYFRLRNGFTVLVKAEGIQWYAPRRREAFVWQAGTIEEEEPFRSVLGNLHPGYLKFAARDLSLLTDPAHWHIECSPGSGRAEALYQGPHVACERHAIRRLAVTMVAGQLRDATGYDESGAKRMQWEFEPPVKLEGRIVAPFETRLEIEPSAILVQYPETVSFTGDASAALRRPFRVPFPSGRRTITIRCALHAGAVLPQHLSTSDGHGRPLMRFDFRHYRWGEAPRQLKAIPTPPPPGPDAAWNEVGRIEAALKAAVEGRSLSTNDMPGTFEKTLRETIQCYASTRVEVEATKLLFELAVNGDVGIELPERALAYCDANRRVFGPFWGAYVAARLLREYKQQLPPDLHGRLRQLYADLTAQMLWLEAVEEIALAHERRGEPEFAAALRAASVRGQDSDP